MVELSNSNKDEHPEHNTVVHNYFFFHHGEGINTSFYGCAVTSPSSLALSHTRLLTCIAISPRCTKEQRYFRNWKTEV